MTTNKEVVATHEAHPTWTSAQIAEHLGCGRAYVSATAQRQGIALNRRRAVENDPRTLRAEARRLLLKAEKHLIRATLLEARKK